MKSLFLIILMSTTIGAMGQIENEIPKRAWKIIVQNNLTAADNFRLAALTLLQNDFTIEEKNEEFGQLKSSGQSVKGLNGTYFIKILTTDNKITITGEAKLNVNIVLTSGGVGAVSTESYSRVENKGMRGSLLRNSFEQMNEFAQGFEGQISYITD